MLNRFTKFFWWERVWLTERDGWIQSIADQPLSILVSQIQQGPSNVSVQHFPDAPVCGHGWRPGWNLWGHSKAQCHAMEDEPPKTSLCHTWGHLFVVRLLQKASFTVHVFVLGYQAPCLLWNSKGNPFKYEVINETMHLLCWTVPVGKYYLVQEETVLATGQQLL